MIERALVSDRDALLALENGIFSVDFLQKVPKLYTDPAVCAACHGVIRENGRIAAAVAAYPTKLETCCGTLGAIGVGSVAVEEASRGKGYLKELLGFCSRRAEETGAVLAFLSGFRGRYARDGYVPCGRSFRFEVSDYFISRFKGKTFSFVSLDRAHLDAAAALFEAQPLRWTRKKEDFLCITTSWYGRAYAALDEAGTFCGYVIAEKDRAALSEVLLTDEANAAAALVSYARQFDLPKLTVHAEPTQTALIGSLAAFTEHIETEMPAAFKVYDWKRFIEVLGSCKAKLFALQEGELVLQIEAETLRVKVENGACIVTPCPDAPDLVFTAEEAAMALTTDFGSFVPHALFAAWAPLCPLGIPHPDRV